MTENDFLISRADALCMLCEELEKGRRSGDEKGWLTEEEVWCEFELDPLEDEESG